MDCAVCLCRYRRSYRALEPSFRVCNLYLAENVANDGSRMMAHGLLSVLANALPVGGPEEVDNDKHAHSMASAPVLGFRV